MKQFTKLLAIKNFTMKVPRKRGKPTSVKAGDKFWITSPEYKNTQNITIARVGRGCIGHGYTIELSLSESLFEVITE